MAYTHLPVVAEIRRKGVVARSSTLSLLLYVTIRFVGSGDANGGVSCALPLQCVHSEFQRYSAREAECRAKS